MTTQKHSRVVAAVIRRGNKFLCMKRCRSKYDYISERWEFPGGKVDTEEDDCNALKREIHEEMDWDIQVERHLATINYEYPDFNITLVAYLCTCGTKDDFKLLEHLDYKWLTPDMLDSVEWTAADAELIKQTDWHYATKE